MIYAVLRDSWKWDGGGMNRRNVILAGLGVLELLVAGLAFFISGMAVPAWIALPCAAVLYAQPYLVGIWIAFGERTLPWRAVAVAAVLTCLTHCMHDVSSMTTQAIFGLSPGIVLILGLLLLGRAFGLRFYDSSSHTLAASPRFQFSLRHMLEWTAAVAVLCSLATVLPPGSRTEIHAIVLNEATMLCVIHGFTGGVCLALLGVVLGMRRPRLGLAWLVPPVLLVAGLVGAVTPAGILGMGAFAVCFMVWMSICFFSLRHFGYRYGRPHMPTASPFANDESGDNPFQELPDSAEGVVAQ